MMENAITHTTDITTIASSIVTLMATVLASLVTLPMQQGQVRIRYRTSMVDEQHDIRDVLPHITANLDAVGPGLSPTLNAASPMSETPYLDSIQSNSSFVYISHGFRYYCLLSPSSPRGPLRQRVGRPDTNNRYAARTCTAYVSPAATAADRQGQVAQQLLEP
jgi:hypothetical protein